MYKKRTRGKPNEQLFRNALEHSVLKFWGAGGRGGGGSVSIGGRLITNFRFTDDIVVMQKNKLPGRPSRYNHHKVQNRDRSRQDKSDDKQPKWLPKRDQDKRSEARNSGELQVTWSNHLQRRINARDSFQDSPDNSSSF